MLKNESMQLQHLNFVGARMTSSPTGYCCSGSQVRKEAWKVRRLVSEFSKAARRPHWPREHAMQVLFRTAGISNWREADGIFHYLINIYFLICFILNQVLPDSVVKRCSYMCPLKTLPCSSQGTLEDDESEHGDSSEQGEDSESGGESEDEYPSETTVTGWHLQYGFDSYNLPAGYGISPLHIRAHSPQIMVDIS